MLLDFEDGALVRRWLHGPEVDEPLAYERYAGTTAGGSGTALELFRNRLGSVILAVSVSTGAVAAEYDYDSFGQRTLVQGTEEVRYGFTAREHDARTGLIHYRARAYDPLTGRFLQRDPIGFASGDLNLYAYVENDPYNWTDPSGLTPSAGTAVGIQRDSAIRGALSPVFSGVLGFAQRLANAMRGYQSIAGTASAVMSQSDDGRLEDETDPDDLGDLTDQEVDEIQDVVEEAQRPLDVVGSAANGDRRNVGSDLPIGKGEGTRSDIDYTTAGANRPNFEGLEDRLPGLDPDTGLLSGTPESGSESIRFEPGTRPIRIRN